MKILKINNQYNCENRPSIISEYGNYWYVNNKLHRSGQPAIITPYSQLYYHRGIKITKDIAKGKLSIEQILKIDNMELRQSAMEILGYEKFFKVAKELHRFTPEGYEPIYPVKTNPMYILSRMETGQNELNDPIVILTMVDPSKIPLIKYFIRVHPDETDCRLAVAHSYGFDTWEQYADNKNWV